MRLQNLGPGTHISQTAQAAVDLVASGEPSVEFDFNEIELVVKPGMSAADVVAEYNRICEERAAAYRASPAYAEREREWKARAEQQRIDRARVLQGAPEHMTIRDEAAWSQWKANNTDGYGGGVITYADRWGRMMEGMIAAGATVAGCAKEASNLADEEGITGFMYGCAVQVLAQCWIHGEELRRWHNLDTQIGTEGEKANESGGVLNPAVLSIG